MVFLEGPDLILTRKYVTSDIKMPVGRNSRVMRRVGRYSRGGPIRRVRQSTAARFLRRIASPTMSAAMARVHTFKRVGNPVVITNSTLPGTRAIAQGNADIIAGAGALAGGPDTSIATASQIRGAMRFCLEHAANRQDITNLFDNYRIAKIKLMFNFACTDATLTNNQFCMPVINYCYDPDDNGTPADRTSVLENGYAAVKRLDRPFSLTITPRAQQSVVGGGAAGGGLLPVGNWLDSGSPQIYHYGLKFVIDQFPFLAVDNTVALTITPVFYLEAKNVV